MHVDELGKHVGASAGELSTIALDLGFYELCLLHHNFCILASVNFVVSIYRQDNFSFTFRNVRPPYKIREQRIKTGMDLLWSRFKLGAKEKFGSTKRQIRCYPNPL